MQPTPLHNDTSRPGVSHSLARVASRLLTPAPLSLLNPALVRIAVRLSRSRPDLFSRMGAHTRKTFLIDPTDLPLVLTMTPDTASPRLTAHGRYDIPPHDGAIAGRFVHLLDMIDGSLDGDALFFNRNLSVSGDVEAVVALRNALDDFDGDLVREILGALGPLCGVGGVGLKVARALSAAGVRYG